MALTGPPNNLRNTHQTAEPTCAANCQGFTPNPTESLGVTMTNFLADEAMAFNLFFAEVERIVNGYLKLLSDTTDHQLRRVAEDNTVALQAMITEILRR